MSFSAGGGEGTQSAGSVCKGGRQRHGAVGGRARGLQRACGGGRRPSRHRPDGGNSGAAALRAVPADRKAHAAAVQLLPALQRPEAAGRCHRRRRVSGQQASPPGRCLRFDRHVGCLHCCLLSACCPGGPSCGCPRCRPCSSGSTCLLWAGSGIPWLCRILCTLPAASLPGLFISPILTWSWSISSVRIALCIDGLVFSFDTPLTACI